MKRFSFILLLLIPWLSLHASILEGKERSPDETADTEDTLQHRVGLGFHSFLDRYFPFINIPFVNNGVDPTSGSLTLQASYVQDFKKLQIRTGLLGGGWYSLGDRMELEHFGVNVGLQKKVWQPGDVYSLTLGADLLYGFIENENPFALLVYDPSRVRPIYEKEHRFGLGIAFLNNFRISTRSSIVLEWGLSGGYAHTWTLYSNGNDSYGGGFEIFDLNNSLYRDFVLSYNYHF